MDCTHIGGSPSLVVRRLNVDALTQEVAEYLWVVPLGGQVGGASSILILQRRISSYN